MDKRRTILGALYVARDQYKKDAQMARHPVESRLAPGWERVAKQFDQQAKDCETLIDQMEDDDDYEEPYVLRDSGREDFHSDG